MNRQADQISDRDFYRLRDLIGSQCGMVLAPAKRIMLETRLGKRVRALGLDSLAAYCEFIRSPRGKKEEWPSFIDAITTHKTNFFREPAHFDFLLERALPELLRYGAAGTRRPLRLWSAGCSTGEEPYTLAIVLSGYLPSSGEPACLFRICATDISTAVLETAERAVYSEEDVQPVPEELRRRCFLRSKDHCRGMVRIIPGIRALIEFRQLNLMEADYGFADPLDVVFCRNVMIYFERSTQELILNRICRTLRLGGFLFMGHAESLNGLNLPLVPVAPTVYRRTDV